VFACRSDGLLDPEDYEEVPYPHPYLEMWLTCQRYQSSQGHPVLPDPTKGPLDQDADTMLAFEILEQLVLQWQDEEKLRERNRKVASEMHFHR